MTTHHVTFSDESMSRSAQRCVESAMANSISAHWFYTPEILHRFEEVKAHPEVFINPSDPRRAFAHWAWKPLIINEVISELNAGDVLVYSDAGIEFINNVNYIIDRMDQDIFLFGNNWEHAHWCKRDTAEVVWPCNEESRCPSPHYGFWDKFGKQVQASVIFFRVSDYTRQFVKEWLDWCLFEGGRLIDDSPSRTPNHPEFREHRHDQAILTTMAYREGIELHYWPASYNDGAFTYEQLPEYAGDDYPILFNHHRRRNADWEQAA